MSNGMTDRIESPINLLTVLARTLVMVGLFLPEKCLLLQGAMVNLAKLPKAEKVGLVVTVLLVVSLRPLGIVQTTALVVVAVLSERVVSGSGEGELTENLLLVVGVSAERGIGTLVPTRMEVMDAPIVGVGMGSMIGMVLTIGRTVLGTGIWALIEMRARVGRVAQIGTTFLVETTDAFKVEIMTQAGVVLAVIVF